MSPHEPNLCRNDERNPHVVEIEDFGKGLEEVAQAAIITGASMKEIQTALNSVAQVTFRIYNTLGKRMRVEAKAIKTV